MLKARGPGLHDLLAIMRPKERERWDRNDLTGEERGNLLQAVRYRWNTGERPLQPKAVPSASEIEKVRQSLKLSEDEARRFLESASDDDKSMRAYREYLDRQRPPDDLVPSPPTPAPDWTQTRKRNKRSGDVMERLAHKERDDALPNIKPPFNTEKNTRLKNALDLLTQHPKLSAGGGATVFLIAAVSLEFSGGKPWKVGLAAAIGYLLAFLLLVFVFYEARLFANYLKGTIAASAAILITITTLWYLLLPDAPLTAQDIAAEVWKRAPTPLQNPSPSPSTQQLKSSEPPSTSGVLEQQQRREIILDRKGVAIHVGMSTLYPQMQIEYIYQTDIYRFVIYVDNTNLTLEVCIRLLDYYPELKAEMLKGVENSSEFYPNLRMAVNSGLVINYKSSLTKEQIDYIKRHAKRLKINVWLEGPAPP